MNSSIARAFFFATCLALVAACESGLRAPSVAPHDSVEMSAPPAVAIDAERREPPSSATDEDLMTRIRPRFRACYKAALDRNPHAEGFVIVGAQIDVDGRVASAAVEENVGFGERTADCLVAIVRSATFAAGGTPGRRLRIPIRFVNDARKKVL